MIVEALIPWGGTAKAKAQRRHGFRIVLQYYRELVQWALPFTLSCRQVGADPFRKGAAINIGAQASVADVVFVNDADSIVHPEQLMRAVSLAEATKGFVFAYDRYCRLDRASSQACGDWRDVFNGDVEWEHANTPSHGAFAFYRQSFLDAGGYDPRLIYWYDDLSFELIAAEYHWERVAGELRHLYHPAQAVPDDDEALWRRYQTEGAAVRSEAGFPC